MYDLVIKNGSLLDGSGAPAFKADIAVKDGKIACIGQALAGETILDVAGLTVTPGFIDSHSHADNALPQYPDLTEKIEQGITTSINGQCGNSPAPMAPFIEAVRDLPLGSNLATFMGHSSLRKAVMGSDYRDPTPAELAAMGDMLRQGIEQGALGLTFGLIYPPSCFSKTEELVYLAKVAAEAGGMLAAHIRNESDELIEACEEFLAVIKASGARAVFSHHKAAYRQNWGKVKTTLAMIDQANREGCDIYCDVYPYTASHTNLSARFVPKQYHDGGSAAMAERLRDPAVRAAIREQLQAQYGEDDYSWLLITVCEGYPQYCGLRLNEIAERHGKNVYDTAFDLIAESVNQCSVCCFSMSEEDIKTVMTHPRSMICTDSSVRGSKAVYHPRLRGSFPRALGRYVREQKVLPLPEMIRKMTALPAAVYGLQGKGLIKEGYDADLCIFDPATIRDRADYTDCHLRAEGLRYVLLGGKVAVENAVHNGTRAGKLILK
ncbi:MAG: D-aminoacylase [Clostridia bacterium]|nr:D-aminoacylase [Clostridia bacterium]